MRNRIKAIAAAAVFAAASSPSYAAAIIESFAHTGDPFAAAPYAGQSFILPGTSLTQYKDITANFFSAFNATPTPFASGNLYIFSSAYTGTVADLATSTLNLMGVGSASGNQFSFDQNMTLYANNVYYAYNDTLSLKSSSATDFYFSGQGYGSNSSIGSFTATPGMDFDFRISGTGFQVQPQLPEPATWAMMLMGFGLIGAASRYRSTGHRNSQIGANGLTAA